MTNIHSGMLKEKWVANPDADFLNDAEGLAKLLVREVAEYYAEQKGYDENDGFYDYLGGLISARLTIIGRMGYDAYIPEDLGDFLC